MEGVESGHYHFQGLQRSRLELVDGRDEATFGGEAWLTNRPIKGSVAQSERHNRR